MSVLFTKNQTGKVASYIEIMKNDQVNPVPISPVQKGQPFIMFL